jgi:hypothetical protein
LALCAVSALLCGLRGDSDIELPHSLVVPRHTEAKINRRVFRDNRRYTLANIGIALAFPHPLTDAVPKLVGEPER